MIFKYVKSYKAIEIGDFGGKILKFEYTLFSYSRVLYKIIIHMQEHI